MCNEACVTFAQHLTQIYIRRMEIVKVGAGA
jgi:hypothetical protein